MPYNYMGDLYKSEVAFRLKEMGYNIKNVHSLNLILEEMGILKHSGNNWLTTKEGLKYTLLDVQAYDVQAWHPTIIDAVAHYLNNKR